MFADRIGGAETQSVASPLRDVTLALQDAWMHFEIEMENWAVAAEQKNAAFDARARALLGAWHAAAAGYRAQALTVAAADERRRIDAAIARLEREAAAFGETFENLKDAGTLSWIAVGEALKDSRAAFERANANARAAFSLASRRDKRLKYSLSCRPSPKAEDAQGFLFSGL